MKKLSEIFILILAWIMAVLGMLCLALGLYLLPYLFNWFHVDFLDYLIKIMPELTNAPQLKSIMAKLGIAISFILIGGLFWLVSRYFSNMLRTTREDEKLAVNEAAMENANIVEAQEEVAEALTQAIMTPTIKVLLAVLAVIVLMLLLEYLISIEFLGF